MIESILNGENLLPQAKYHHFPKQKKLFIVVCFLVPSSFLQDFS